MLAAIWLFWRFIFKNILKKAKNFRWFLKIKPFVETMNVVYSKNDAVSVAFLADDGVFFLFLFLNS